MRTEQDVERISGLIDAFGEALHAQDLERSMAPLAQEDDLVVIPSEGVDVFRGSDAVRAFLSRIYDSPRRYGWRWQDRWISVEGRAAWFVAAGRETVEEAGATRVIPYCLTGVAVQTTSGWRLRLLHASEDPHSPLTTTA